MIKTSKFDIKPFSCALPANDVKLSKASITALYINTQHDQGWIVIYSKVLIYYRQGIALYYAFTSLLIHAHRDQIPNASQ